MSEVRKGTFRNTQNDDNKHKLYNMILHMSWDYIRWTKRKIKTRTKKNKEWLFFYLILHNCICNKFSKNFINITLIYLITKKKVWGNNFNNLDANNMQTKPWCSPMTSKAFCLLWCSRLLWYSRGTWILLHRSGVCDDIICCNMSWV